jgi:hypothetical protein
VPPQYDGYLGHCPKCNRKLRLMEKIQIEKTDNPIHDIIKFKKLQEKLIEKSEKMALLEKP